MMIESGVRRIQRELNLPYLALFDSFRFYEACINHLPEYDICHEHFGVFSIGAALACSKLRIPYILTLSAEPLLERSIVGEPLRGFQAFIAAWGEKFIFRTANKIICVSEPTRQHLINVWGIEPEKIVVMPNGVNIELFGIDSNMSELRKDLGFDRDLVIGFVGSFREWHGIDLLVESFSIVLSHIPNAKLLLIGDGPARQTVEQKIKDFNLESSVRITGFIDHSRVSQMLALTDIAVIPYPKFSHELWFSPLKLYEYMGAGKAIVSSKSGQIMEVIKHDYTGLLVEPGDIKGFADAIVELSKNPEKRKQLGDHAMQQALERHSWKQYVKQLEEIYLSVI